MIPDTKWVGDVEAKPGGKSGTYWTITWHDGKHDNIFNEAWKDLCEQAKAEGLAVHFTKEQNPKGYWNIVALELVSQVLPESTDPPTDMTPPKAHIPPPRAEQTEAKVDTTRKSIERQTSLKCATEWCIAQLQAGNPLKTTEIVSIAAIFESYLDSGLEQKIKYLEQKLVETKGVKDGK